MIFCHWYRLPLYCKFIYSPASVRWDVEHGPTTVLRNIFLAFVQNGHAIPKKPPQYKDSVRMPGIKVLEAGLLIDQRSPADFTDTLKRLLSMLYQSETLPMQRLHDSCESSKVHANPP